MSVLGQRGIWTQFLDCVIQTSNFYIQAATTKESPETCCAQCLLHEVSEDGRWRIEAVQIGGLD
ncbi:hypothetical protein FRX31_029956 [Thalictrum thalictroides]|uniref:Uncharacterized protein n=1 Tax=Thalictrum thalictroides TaxID=46969 RepID=A0A7J6V6T4_THATH|nr:hypothetical protein FRX31_029956 [Thalictrum thalictroides]